jgi:hypothetical protein
MQRIGNQLLAGAVLALDEDVRVAGRNGLHELEQLAHFLALADDAGKRVLAAQLLFELLVVLPFVVERQRAFENGGNAGRIEIRLFDEEKGACLTCLESALDRSLPADHDHLGRRIDALHFLEQGNAIGVGQQEIEENHGRSPGVKQLLAAGTVAGAPDFVARLARRLFDDHLQPVGHHRLVIDDEHAFT